MSNCIDKDMDCKSCKECKKEYIPNDVSDRLAIKFFKKESKYEKDPLEDLYVDYGGEG